VGYLSLTGNKSFVYGVLVLIRSAKIYIKFVNEIFTISACGANRKNFAGSAILAEV